MGMYIYINNEDRITKRKVKDESVNLEFQEALKHEPNLMIEEYETVQKRIFRKNIVKTMYNILHEAPAFDSSAYQARYQFSGSGSKEIVIAYLHGIINGAIAQNQ